MTLITVNRYQVHVDTEYIEKVSGSKLHVTDMAEASWHAYRRFAVDC